MTPDQLTDDQKALIRGMNMAACLQWPRASNIAALHFDGQVLIDLLMAKRELEAPRKPA